MSTGLPRGAEVGRFRIDALVGAGGMGEVYRAWDDELGRFVALKILPEGRTSDPQRVERFVREARAASALAHPHIVSIFEIGRDVLPGPEENAPTTVHFIAMELVDGRNLRQAIYDERLRLRDLLRVLAQAAEGVSRAHEAGIVHRDLKPDNVMITRDGYAKVLDFGLAKLLPQADRSEGLTSAPTEANPSPTREGELLGTVGYMSPEQVKGRPVDHRTDVFSFGCLLYEAATRSRPFEAQTAVEVMHRILKDEPRPMEELNPEVPSALRRLVKRCLAKSIERRFQSMKDLALELADLVEEYDSLAPASTVSGSTLGGAARLPPRQRHLGSWAIVAVAITVLLGVGWWIRSSAPADPGPLREPATPAILSMRALTSSSDISQVAISPDGDYLALGRWMKEGTGLWIQHVPTGSSVEVVAPTADLHLRGVAFTPDGHHLIFVRNDVEQPLYSSAYEVPVLGGPTRKLFVDIDSGPAISPDGETIAFVRGAPQEDTSYLMVVSADGSGTEIVAESEEPADFDFVTPAWTADGSSLLVVQRRPDGRRNLLSIDRATGNREALLEGEFRGIEGLATRPDGKGVILVGARGDENQRIWNVALQSGTLRRLSNDLDDYDGASITADGKALVSRHAESTSSLFIAPADEPEALRLLTGLPRDFVYSVAAGPGRTVYYTLRDAKGGLQVWRLDIGDESPVQLTREGNWLAPSASADGAVLMAPYRASPAGPMQLWRLDPRTGEKLRLLVESEAVWRADVAPDASYVTWVDGEKTIWVQDLEGGEARRLAEQTYRGPFISPDGSRIAYRVFRTDDAGSAQAVFEARTPAGELVAAVPVRVMADEDVHGWHPTQDGIVGSRWIGGTNNLWLLPFDGSGWTQLTRFEHRVEDFLMGSAWTRDGRWFVAAKGRYLSDAVLIELP